MENMQRLDSQLSSHSIDMGDDTEDEIAILANHCKELGVGFAENNVFTKGGEGAEDLARLVVDTIDKHGAKDIKMVYNDDDSIEEKVNKTAKNITVHVRSFSVKRL